MSNQATSRKSTFLAQGGVGMGLAVTLGAMSDQVWLRNRA